MVENSVDTLSSQNQKIKYQIVIRWELNLKYNLVVYRKIDLSPKIGNQPHQNNFKIIGSLVALNVNSSITRFILY